MSKYKLPKEVKILENNIVSNSRILFSDIPNRTSRKYKSSLKKYLKTYFNYDIDYTDESIKSAIMYVNKLSYEVKVELKVIVSAYRDLKNNHSMIVNTINEYTQQRLRKMLTINNNQSVCFAQLSEEKNDISNYRYKIINSYVLCENKVRKNLLDCKFEMLRFETNLKLYKKIRQELQYMMNRI